MTTVGRWSPNKVRYRVLSDTWVVEDDFQSNFGMALIKPTSVVSTGTGNSSSISSAGSVTFSLCDNISLNGVFSSSFDNYVVTMRHVSPSTADKDLRMRLRVNGTDNATASSYVGQELTARATTVSTTRNTTTYINIGTIDTTVRTGISIYLYGPFIAQSTAIRSICMDGISSAGIRDVAATHNQSVAYDGFSLFPSSGTMTGLIAVYGFGG